MLENVFTYGTLQVPAVMLAVTGRELPCEPAALPGYRRYRIKNRVYPAIIADSTATTEGTLYKALDEEALTLLDEFEDVLYDRLVVDVQNNQGRVEAYAYVVAERFRHRLSESEWDLKEFEKNHLASYLRRIHG